MAYRCTVVVVGSCKRKEDATPWLNAAFDAIHAINVGSNFVVMTKCDERLAEQVKEVIAQRGWAMVPLGSPEQWGAMVSINAGKGNLGLVAAFTERFPPIGFIPLWQFPG